MDSHTQHEATSRQAFEQGLREHLPAMFRFAVSLSNRNDAEDIVQDALTRAWVKRAAYDPNRGTLLGWLLAIVADQARARWRRGSTRRTFPVADLGDVPFSEDEVMGADLRRAVGALPPRQRTAVVLHHFVDLPVAEVATLMGVSAGTVKSTLHDARASLARELGASYALDRRPSRRRGRPVAGRCRRAVRRRHLRPRAARPPPVPPCDVGRVRPRRGGRGGRDHARGHQQPGRERRGPLAGPTPERSAPGGNTSPSGGGGASASCAGPELSFRDPLRHRHVRFTPRLPHPVQAGTSVRIYGAFFLATCNDTGQGVPDRPVRSVRLMLHPSSGPRRTLIVAHPSGPLGRFSLSVRIPDNIASGPATITDGYGYGGLSLDIAD